MKSMLRILLLTMMVCCWSCSGGEDDPINPTPKPEEKPKIEVTTTAPVLAQEGGTASVTFTSSADWTIDVTEGRAVSWCTVSPTSGSKGTNTLTVTTTSNDTYDERNAKVTIKAGATSQSFTVTQKQKDGLTVTSNKVEIGSDGGNFSIETKANVSVTYEIEESAKDWISASESRGLTTKTLNFTAKANDKTERRQGNIVLKGGDGLTETVTVYQAGEEVSLVLTTEKDMTIGSEGGNLKIELQSNSEIKMEALEADWLRQSSSRSMSAYTYYLEVDANDTYDERNTSITFTSGDKKQIVTVTQKQKDALIVTSNKVEIYADGGNFSIETKANVSVTYEIEESAKDWISASESRGLTTKTLNFTAKANDKTERRQGNIVLKGGDGLTETITVYQEGEKPALVITSDDIIVGSDGESIKIELKSNVDYTITMPEADWISKDESRAVSAYTHYLVVAPNETYDQRNAVVFFQNEVEGLKDSINITQLQKDAIIVAKNEYTVAAEGGNLDFSVNTNVDFEVSTSVDWIEQNTKSRALIEKTLSFVIAENDNTKPREGEIVITCQDLKQTIKVTQKGSIDYEAIERAALIEFYQATNGDNWVNNENWCSDKPLNEWYGVYTMKGRISSLDLLNNNLNGYIPESFGNLTSLLHITMSFSQIYGQLPESIGNLSELRSLFLRANNSQMTGSIPESIGKLKKLESLYLFDTKLNGIIPESIGNLTSLDYLLLYGNHFSGNFPESFGNLESLEDFYISNCNFNGNIPESIGNLKSLKTLIINSSFSDAKIPESIGNLNSLEHLSMSGNSFIGGIPKNIGNLKKIKSIGLNGNQIDGNIPESIGNLTSLESINLYNNKLTGSIPESIGNLTALKKVDFRKNLLSGKIPTSLTKLENFKNFWPGLIFSNLDFDLNGILLPAPDFSVTDIYGNTITSQDEYANNKLTILYKWAYWCGYSIDFNHTLQKLYNLYHKLGLEIIGSCDKAVLDETKTFIKENSIPWKNFINEDLNNSIPPLYYIISRPHVIVINENKEIIFQSITESCYELENFIKDYFDSNNDIYTSTDYSRDGEVVTLQTATQGKGINLTFMGEAFVDKDMASGGLYEQKMEEAMEKFFSIEPYKSLRDRFNVYAVKVVSPNAEFMDGAKHRINLSDSICFEYAKKIPNVGKNPPMVSVVYNTSVETDRSYTTMYSDGSFVGYIMDGISNVLIHEAGGHGFANLLDEYVENGLENSTLSEDEATFLDNMWSAYSWGANVDWRNDRATVKWSHFLNDSRYANEGLGLYEGAYLYGHGAYRPTENSMMRYNDSPFNAPSREQIYKRIMQLSEGENWKYDYEEFVKFDEKNRNAASRAVFKPLTEAKRKEYIKNHRPPRFIKGTWRDAIKRKDNIVVPFR